VSAVLFAIGAVLGTVHSFEMGLLWPAPMGRSAMFSACRSRWKGCRPVAMSGIVGSFLVVSVNAWMNNPAGFTIDDGIVTDINLWAACSTTWRGCSPCTCGSAPPCWSGWTARPAAITPKRSDVSATVVSHSRQPCFMLRGHSPLG
jgi:hypothetical protein